VSRQFKPCTNILPPSQQRLWLQLRAAAFREVDLAALSAGVKITLIDTANKVRICRMSNCYLAASRCPQRIASRGLNKVAV
jgi:hypothetical protein